MISYGILTVLAPNFTKFVCFFAKKLSINLEIPHFLMFSAKCCECKIVKRDGYGKSRSGHGKVIEKSWKNNLSSMWKPGQK